VTAPAQFTPLQISAGLSLVSDARWSSSVCASFLPSRVSWWLLQPSQVLWLDRSPFAIAARESQFAG